LRDAMESTIFVCGMAPLDTDDPTYVMFQRDPSLKCNTHIEADCYIRPESGLSVLSYVAIALENSILRWS
jgi:hypothetical protein